jgi:hypothetical protein
VEWLAFIPSGSLKDSVKLLDYGGDQVLILKLDYTTPDAATGTAGLCIDSTTGVSQLGTSSPKIEMFATGVNDAWSFLFDPQVRHVFTQTLGYRVRVMHKNNIFTDVLFFLHAQTTNDFFTTSWGDGTIVQFEGFPPGVNMQVAIENIATSIEIIGGLYIGRHRFLAQGSKESETQWIPRWIAKPPFAAVIMTRACWRRKLSFATKVR